MKIKLTNTYFPIRKQLLMFFMKVFIFLCCTTIFALTPNDVVSQNSKIKITKDRTLTVDEVFDLIMEQTNYKFFYEEGIFKSYPKVHVKKGFIGTNEIIEQSLSQGNFIVEVTKNRSIIIKEKKSDHNTGQQQYQVEGTVLDSNGQPLPGANIIEKGTTNGTQTDFDGNFTINLKDGNAVLLIS